MTTDYGTLCDYKTGDSIRPATETEWRASRESEAASVGGGTGAITVDGQTAYVAGGPDLPRIGQMVSVDGDSAMVAAYPGDFGLDPHRCNRPGFGFVFLSFDGGVQVWTPVSKVRWSRK